MAKPMSEEFISSVKQKMEARPERREVYLSKLRQKGYDTTPLEGDPASPSPLPVVPSAAPTPPGDEPFSLAAEAGAFAKGVPEGLTYNVLELDKVPQATEWDISNVPVLSSLFGDRIQPSRELGRIAGGIPTGGLVAGTGARLAGRTAGPIARLLGASVAEGVAGATAQGIREDDPMAAVGSFPTWFALGLGSNTLGHLIVSRYAKRKGQPGASITTPNTSEVRQAVGESWKRGTPKQRQQILQEAQVDPEVAKVVPKDEDLPPIPPRVYGAGALMEDVPPPTEPPPWLRAEKKTEAVAPSSKPSKKKGMTAKQEKELSEKVDAPPTAPAPSKRGLTKDQQEELKSLREQRKEAYRRHSLGQGSPTLVGELDAKIVRLRLLEGETPVGETPTTPPKGDGLQSRAQAARVLALKEKIAAAEERVKGYARIAPGKGADDEALRKAKETAYQQLADLEADLAAIEGKTPVPAPQVRADLRADGRSLQEAVLEAEGLLAQADQIIKEDKALSAALEKKMRDAAILNRGQEPELPRPTPKETSAPSVEPPSDPAFSAKVDQALKSPNVGAEVPRSGDFVSIRKPKFTFRGEVVEATPGRIRLRAEDGQTRWHNTSDAEVEVLARGQGGGSGPPPSNSTTPATPLQRARIAQMLDDLHLLNPGRNYDPTNTISGPTLSSQQAAEVIRNLEDDLALTRTRHVDDLAMDMEGVRFGAPFSDRKPPSVSAVTLDVSDEALKKEAPRLFGPTSRWGLSGNPKAAQMVRYTLQKTEEGQALYERWIQMYNSVRRSLELPEAGSLRGLAKVGAAGLRSLVTGKQSALEQGRLRLFALARALDADDPAVIQQELAQAGPGAQAAYTQMQQLLAEVADKLGLSAARRLLDYLPHIFLGRGGAVRAGWIAEQLDPAQARWVTDYQKAVSEGATSVVRDPKQPFFRHLARRTGAQGFEYDLDLIMNMYLRGAVQKIVGDKVIEEGAGILPFLPRRTQRDAAKYLLHATGKPTEARERVANFYANNELFNKGVDRLVEFLGGARYGILTEARRGVDEDAVVDAINFLSDMEQAVRVRDRVSGAKLRPFRSAPGDFVRSKAALKVEDLRRALGNENLTGPVANQIYRIQMLAKLGLNASQAILNLSQLPTNTAALLGYKYTGRGIENYLFKSNANKQIHGRAVKDILMESGVTRDVSRYEEFIELGPGTLMKELQDVAFAPSRFSEQINRGSTLLGAYEKFRDLGDAHHIALGKAVQIVERTQFPFNKAGTHPALRGPVWRLLLMFKSYPIFQTEFTAGLIADAIQKGEVAPLARHLMGYMGLLASGLVLDEMFGTNLVQKTMPPLPGMVDDVRKNLGRARIGALANATLGPFSETSVSFLEGLIDLAEGQGSQAVKHFTHSAEQFAVPRSVQKVYQGRSSPLDILGLQAPKKPLRILQ